MNLYQELKPHLDARKATFSFDTYDIIGVVGIVPQSFLETMSQRPGTVS